MKKIGAGILLLSLLGALTEVFASSTPPIGDTTLPSSHRTIPTKEPRRQAYVFSGGGSLGAFEVGVVDYLSSQQHLNPKILVGASTGSIIAAKLAEGPAAIGQLKQQYLGLHGYRDIYTARPFLTKLAWDQGVLTELAGADARSTGDLIARYGIMTTLTLKGRAKDTAFDAAQAVGDALNAPSLFDNAPLRQSLSNNLSPAKVQTSGNQVRLATVNMHDGKLYFVKENGGLYCGDDEQTQVAQVGLIDAVMASAAMPVAFPPQTLAGHPYFDGGIREMIPVRKAMQLGANDIYVIYANRGATPMAGNPKLLGVMGRATDLALDEITNNDVPHNEKLEVTVARRLPSDPTERDLRPLPAKVTLHEFRPAMDLHNSLTFDPGLSAIAMDYGYMVAADRTTKEAVDVTANRLTELRYQAWAKEYEFLTDHNKNQDTSIFPIAERNGSYVVSPDTKDSTMGLGCNSEELNPLRDLKREIRKQVKARRDAGLVLPANANRWWQGFEAHSEFFQNDRFAGWNDPWAAGQCGYVAVPACDSNAETCPPIR